MGGVPISRTISEFVLCKCGHSGFRTEEIAKSWVARKKTRGEQAEHVKCPTDDCWHGFEPRVKSREQYLSWLMNDKHVKTDAHGRKFVPPTQDELTPLTLPPDATILRIASEVPTSEPVAAIEVRAPPAECIKIRYGSKAVANLVLADIAQQSGRTESTAYECSKCGHWHITSMKGDPAELRRELLVQFSSDLAVLNEVWPDGSTNGLVFVYQSSAVRILKRDLPTLAVVIAHVIGEPPKNPARGRTPRVSRSDALVEYVRTHPGTSASQVAKDCACPSTEYARKALVHLRNRLLLRSEGDPKVGLRWFVVQTTPIAGGTESESS